MKCTTARTLYWRLYSSQNSNRLIIPIFLFPIFSISIHAGLNFLKKTGFLKGNLRIKSLLKIIAGKPVDQNGNLESGAAISITKCNTIGILNFIERA